MEKTAEELINSLFEGGVAPSPEQLTQFVDETLAFVERLKNKAGSEDPTDREGALEEAQQMKSLLESKMERMMQESGIDPKEFLAALEKGQLPAGASTEEGLSLIEKAESQLAGIRQIGKAAKIGKTFIR